MTDLTNPASAAEHIERALAYDTGAYARFDATRYGLREILREMAAGDLPQAQAARLAAVAQLVEGLSDHASEMHRALTVAGHELGTEMEFAFVD